MKYIPVWVNKNTNRQWVYSMDIFDFRTPEEAFEYAHKNLRASEFVVLEVHARLTEPKPIPKYHREEV